jgi:large subunit ribosomal protein L31
MCVWKCILIWFYQGEKIDVEICSNCHPFYTGNEKVLDAAGRVEKFRTRQSVSKTKKSTKK